jgi:hypothetical protein
MNGFIKRTIALIGLGGLAVMMTGCIDCRLCNYYDNCWLTRNGYQAEQSVLEAFGTQVHNGHVLDQTIWTYHFEPGTAILTRGGMEHLSYLARRRPHPDTCLYLQTAQDVEYDPANPEKYSTARVKLDAERIVSIQRFLGAETAGRPVVFEVAVHDPAEVGIPAAGAVRSVLGHYLSYRGSLPGSSGAPSGTTGGPGTMGIGPGTSPGPVPGSGPQPGGPPPGTP